MSWLKSKIKQVAQKASETLAQAADIVAPTLYESRVAEFHHRWQIVQRFLESIMSREVDALEQRRLLLDSHTRDSLQKLVLLICAEENAADRMEWTRSCHRFHSASEADASQQEQPPRECLEYLLEKQVIPHLCDAGCRDEPSGMMSLAMQFIGALLGRVNYPILPTREVHVSVIALIQAATRKEVEDTIVRKCLIALLHALWKKLRADPVQIAFFFHQDTQLSIRKTGSGHSSDYSIQASAFRVTDGDSVDDGQLEDFILFTALLPHMFAVGKTGDRCREALILAAGIPDPLLTRFILTLTPFCHYVINGIISAYDALPKSLPESHGSRGALGDADHEPLDIEDELQMLAIRLRLCCTLAMVGQYEIEEEEDTGAPAEAHRISITNELLMQFRVRFLEGNLSDALLDTSEMVSRTATIYARMILEEICACGQESKSNPILLVFIQFLLEHHGASSDTEDHSRETRPPNPALTDSHVPVELLHRMNALSPSLSIATMDLFTFLVDLNDDFIDSTLLGVLDEGNVMRQRCNSLLSPHSANGTMWFASRFPNSTVACYAHLWKLQGFGGSVNDVERSLAAGAGNDSDTSEDQVVSLLSYIADAEYAACRHVYDHSDDEDGSGDDEDESDGDHDLQGRRLSGQQQGSLCSPSSNKQQCSTNGIVRQTSNRSCLKPLRDVHLHLSIPSFSPVKSFFHRRRSVSHCPETSNSTQEFTAFMKLVLSRLERILESSFQENLALSGLISALAQKDRYAAYVFDLEERLPVGQSVRSVFEEVYADACRRISRLSNGRQRLLEVRRKLVNDDGRLFLDSVEAETRLLCGFVLLEEILKELCSLLFARERIRSLPGKPEGYYLEPRRQQSSKYRGRAMSTDTVASDASGMSAFAFSPRSASSSIDSVTASGTSEVPRAGSIGKEFEQLLADAETKMESLLVDATDTSESMP